MVGNAADTIRPDPSPSGEPTVPGGRWLVTGASGRVGRALRTRLQPSRALRLLDVLAPEPAAAGERVEIVTASLTDQDALTAACADVDAIVHLGGQAKEQPWEEILSANVHGTRCVFEAARRHGITSVVLASSSHAVGCWTRADAGADGLPADVPGRPDTYYGWSKVAMESLGQLYADRYGMSVTSMRIGTVLQRPTSPRALATWLSYDDVTRLVSAAVADATPGMRYVWGISRNARRWWSLAAGEAIGYQPRDDAEAYADEVLARSADHDHDNPRAGDDSRAGDDWIERPLGEPME